MWTPEIRGEIARRCPWQLKAKEYGMVVKALRHLANGTLAMHRLDKPIQRRKRGRDEPNVERRQTQIEEVWEKADRDKTEKRERNLQRQDAAEERAELRKRGERSDHDFDTRQYDG
jgi:hypothetical protein